MNLAEISGVAGAIVGFLLTLMVFSYLFGDNALFRLATHIFIGAAAGYLLAVILVHVLYPRLVQPFLIGPLMPLRIDMIVAVVSVAGSLALLAKGKRIGGLGALVLAFLVGAGAAAAISGAILGTLLPQMSATLAQLDRTALAAAGKTSLGFELLNGMIILVGAAATLAYFQFSARTTPGVAARPLWLQIVAGVGQVFIALALGAVFAGVYAAAMAALIERLDTIVQLIRMLIAPAA